MRKKIALVLTICLICGIAAHGFGMSQERMIQITQREKEMSQAIQDPGAGTVVYTYSAGSGAPDHPEISEKDRQFLRDLTSALEARWQLGEHVPEDLTWEQSMTARGKLVEAELNILAPYGEQELDDPWLDLLAHAYLQGVRNQETAVAQFRDQEQLFAEYWARVGTYYRSTALYQINRYYHVYIAESYQGDMADLLLTGSLLLPYDAVRYMAEAAEGGEQPTDAFGVVDFSAYYNADNTLTTNVKIRNDMDLTVSDVSMVLCFLDGEGTIIDTETVSTSSRIHAGQAIEITAQIASGKTPASVYVDMISYTDAKAQKQNVYMNHTETFALPDPSSSSPTVIVSEEKDEYQQGLEAYEAGNYQEALALFQISAEQGNADAQCALGNMYSNGEGVPAEDQIAIHWYELAANQGHTESQMRLGRIYFARSDYANAAEYSLLAAAKGEPNAQNLIGVMYANGLNFEQSYEKAARYYTMAASQGLGKAQANLGILYYHGQFFEQSYSMAAEWFLKAAEQNDANAQYYLGMLYENGQGVEKSREKAKAYYQLAADQGNAQAQERLKNLK